LIVWRVVRALSARARTGVVVECFGSGALRRASSPRQPVGAASRPARAPPACRTEHQFIDLGDDAMLFGKVGREKVNARNTRRHALLQRCPSFWDTRFDEAGSLRKEDVVLIDKYGDDINSVVRCDPLSGCEKPVDLRFNSVISQAYSPRKVGVTLLDLPRWISCSFATPYRRQ